MPANPPKQLCGSWLRSFPSCWGFWTPLQRSAHDVGRMADEIGLELEVSAERFGIFIVPFDGFSLQTFARKPGPRTVEPAHVSARLTTDAHPKPSLLASVFP